jgi:hypothetical protein
VRTKLPALPPKRQGPTHRWQVIVVLGLMALVFTADGFSQKPQAQLPKIYIDTTYNLPTGGTTWAAHSAAQLNSALKSAQPGDVIVLDAGVTYTGNWQLPQKSNPNNKWIYITTSAYSSLPAPGTRVAISDAANMPKLVSPGNTSVIMMLNGANHYRFVGIEMYPNSNYPAGCPGTRNCTMANFIGGLYPPNPLPDSIFVDRCYFHGTPTQDVQGGFLMNGSNMAIVDSYFDDIHMLMTDSWGAGANISPGPIKIVNNFIAASSENIIFGGGGGGYGGYLTSDIEIRNNYLFKPLSWVPLSTTTHTLVVKNAFEVKAGQRILFDSNLIENVWAGGQLGNAIGLSVRTGQSGDFAVSNDITITNNVLKNVVWFVNGTALDDLCGTSSYPACTNPGSQARWNITNNLVTFYDPTALGGSNNIALSLQPSLNHFTGKGGHMHDIVFQHNTFVQNGSHPCWAGVYFGTGILTAPDPTAPLTDNIWLQDNVFCKQPYGAWGYTPAQLVNYMSSPSSPPYDINARFTGNVMQKQADPTYTWTPNNLVTAATTYVNPPTDYTLLSPSWGYTTDGKSAGVDVTKLP